MGDLKVKIFGKEFLGLLDSEASRIILGSLGWSILKDFASLKPSLPFCIIANKSRCKITGEVSLPINARDRSRVVDVLVVLEVIHRLILSTDFFAGYRYSP